MLLDYITLIAAIGISTAGLSLMIFAAWLMAPKDSFLLTCSVGAALCGGGLLLYGFYVVNPRILVGVMAFSLLFGGMSMLIGAGYQFRTDRAPGWLVIYVALAANVVALPLLALGYTGIGFVPINLTMAALLAAVAVQYWGARAKAPVAVAGLCVLYSLVAASFLLCAVMLIRDGRLVLDGAPSNWAEDLSLLILVACVPAIGAVTLALNQARLARMHHETAMTDPLTGLLNRRALFDAYGERPLPERTAVLVFDIDRFKSINDQHGHSVGDRVILAFASALEAHGHGLSRAARLGGEEFALVKPAASAESALRLAEGVRQTFCTNVNLLAVEHLSCSASAGIAFSGTHGTSFENVLNEADKALYAAKNSGRDRVLSAEPRLAG